MTVVKIRLVLRVVGQELNIRESETSGNHQTNAPEISVNVPSSLLDLVYFVSCSRVLLFSFAIDWGVWIQIRYQISFRLQSNELIHPLNLMVAVQEGKQGEAGAFFLDYLK